MAMLLSTQWETCSASVKGSSMETIIREGQSIDIFTIIYI